jgi:hypothetical protein
MCGDINIFLKSEKEGEIDIMIAENNSKRKGIASESVLLMMKYCIIIFNFKVLII